MQYSGWWRIGLILLSLFNLPSSANRAELEEFVVPLHMNPPHFIPRSTERVRQATDEWTGETAFHAKTAQAAISAAIRHSSTLCDMIRFNGGFGWVVTGHTDYSTQEFSSLWYPVDREARLKAFTDARIRLIDCLLALKPPAQKKIVTHLTQDDAIRLALIKLATTEAEKTKQALLLLARGFVAYSVEEHLNNQTGKSTVQVHLVVTPRTATRLTRPTAYAMETSSLPEGLRQALAEIETGLAPPTGQRLIVVGATGEMALIGHAMQGISNPSSTATDQRREEAVRIATDRATQALIELVTGDETVWQPGLDESARQKLLWAAQGYDDHEPSTRRFAQLYDLARVAATEDPGWQILRDKQLPSSVLVKRFNRQDAVTVAVVYAPKIKRPAPVSASESPTAEPAGRLDSAIPFPAPTSSPPVDEVSSQELSPNNP